MEATVSAPHQGLRMETGWVSLTQAAGLGCARSPLWGCEVRTSISKSLHQIRTLPNSNGLDKKRKISGVRFLDISADVCYGVAHTVRQFAVSSGLSRDLPAQCLFHEGKTPVNYTTD